MHTSSCCRSNNVNQPASEGRSTTSVGRRDLEAWANQSIGFVGLDLSRIGSVVLAQLMQIEHHRIFSVFSVTDEIQAMEGRRVARGTRPEEPFRGAILKGLQKKHFADARFLAENMAAHFAFKKGGNARLEAVVAQAFEENTSGYVDEQFCRTMAHLSTVAVMEERSRAGRLTGEWIIFHRHQGQNFYLTLASHQETDEEILKRVQLACSFDRLPFSYSEALSM